MANATSLLLRFSPVRPWFHLVNRNTIRDDAIAGVTNAAVVLPQGVAFALIAGLPPEYGLFTAIVVAVVAGYWGSSTVMVSGPTTPISAVMFASLSAFALPQSPDYIALAIMLTLLVGVLQLAAGLSGLGSLISFVSHSVIVGFTTAAAVLIAASQLAPALGLTGGGDGAVDRLVWVWGNLKDTNLTALAISVITFASLVGLSRLSRRIPGYIIALVIGSLAGLVLGGAGSGISHFEPLGAVLPSFQLPDAKLQMAGSLLPGAAAVAFIGLLSTISIGKTFAIRRGERFDSNQEIIGQGMANILGSFFHCYAGSGSFTRSGLNLESGAKTPLSGIFAAVFLAIMLIAIAPFVRFIPVPAMAAIILYIAWKLVDVKEIRHIISSSRSETLILLVTFVTGMVSQLDFAILAGVFTSLGAFLRKSSHPLVAVGAPTEVNGKRVFMNAHAYGLDQCPQIRMARLEGPLFFASVEHVERELRKFDVMEGLKTLVLNLKGVGKIDLSGADFILDEVRRARANGRDVRLIAAHPDILGVLKRLHCVEVIGEENIHPHKSDAIAAAVNAADNEICANCRVRIFSECAGKPGN